MSDSAEKLILDFWSSRMSDLLSADNVFNGSPEYDDELLPYLAFSVRVGEGHQTNSSGYLAGELSFDLFHKTWRTGLNVVTELRRRLVTETLTGSGITLDNFRLEFGGDMKEPDGVHHFAHSYTFRIHEVPFFDVEE